MQDLRFRLFGFDVTIQFGFFILVGVVMLFGLSSKQPLIQSVAFAGVIFVSILVHELGHAFISKAFQVPVAGIWIHGFGGEVRHGRTTVGKKFLISLAGPAAGLILGAACFGALLVAQNPMATMVLSLAATINIFWSLFNLLPIFPMDGGQAMLAGLHFVTKPRSAALATFGTGAVLGLGVAVLGWVGGEIFVTFIGGSCAFQNVQMFRRI